MSKFGHISSTCGGYVKVWESHSGDLPTNTMVDSIIHC
jgi:hypothetical protein